MSWISTSARRSVRGSQCFPCADCKKLPLLETHKLRENVVDKIIAKIGPEQSIEPVQHRSGKVGSIGLMTSQDGGSTLILRDAQLACTLTTSLTEGGQSNERSAICRNQARKSKTRYGRRICEARRSRRAPGHEENGRLQRLLSDSGRGRHHCRSVTIHQPNRRTILHTENDALD